MKKTFMIFALIFICAAIFAFDVNKVDANHDGFVDGKELSYINEVYGLKFDAFTGPSARLSYYEFYNYHLAFLDRGDAGIWLSDKLFVHIVVKPRLDEYNYLIYYYDYATYLGGIITARVY